MAQSVRSKVREFETVLERLARILAEEYEIIIIFRHDCCMTDGRRIYLPVIPDNASDEFLGAIQGFLDHEVGHIIDSNFGAFARLEYSDRKRWNILQALEDTRIEYRQRKRWRGAGVNLNRCNDWALKQLKEQWDKLTAFGKMTSGIVVFGCDGKQHWFAQEVLKPDAELWAQLEKVEDLIEETKLLPDTDSTLEQVDRLMARLQMKEEQEPSQPPAEEPDPQSDPQQGQQQKQEPGDPGGPGQGQQKQEPGEPGEPGDPGQPGGSDPGEGPAEPEHSSFLDADDEQIRADEQIRSRHNMIRQHCAQGISKNDRYMIYSTEGDKIETITDGDKVETMRFLKESRRLVNVLLKRMRLNLLSIAQDRWESGQYRGKVDPSAVFRVTMGTSKKVFRKRVQAPSFDTRASLWVDHSGSMEGFKLDLACKAAMLFGEVLHELKIPFEICGYSTTDHHTGGARFRQATSAEQEVYTRWGNHWVGIYKSFDEDWRHVRHRCYRMTRNQKYNTYDGESIRLAAARLLRHSEKRKILFVFNDGQPCPNIGAFGPQHARYLKEVAKEVERVVELFAVGICSDAVKEYYANSVVVNELEDLPRIMLTQLDAMLRKGKTLRQRAA